MDSRQPLVSELSRRRKLALFDRHLRPASTILEVGSGEGWFTTRLRQRGHQVTALDLEPPADVVGDVREWRALGLPEHGFDAIVALEVIEHVDCIGALSELCRPDGLIMLSSPHPRWDWAMKILEACRLTQRRTSPHDHLTDFTRLPLEPLTLRRPMWIHQVGIFRNRPVKPARRA